MKRFVVCAAFALVVAGCGGGGQRVDGAGVQRAITAKLQRSLAPASVSSTRCPHAPPLEPSSTFVCTVRVGDATVSVDVTVIDDTGTIRFATAQPVIVIDQIERDLAAQLHDVYDEPSDTVDVSVDCGDPAVRVARVADRFNCSVVVDGTKLQEEVTVVDKAGNVAFRALD